MKAHFLRRWLDALLPGRPLRVLFVGNSLTYYEAAAVLNDLPGLLSRMSRSRDERRVLLADRLTADGASLEEHAESRALEQRLRPGAWDYVVLQEKTELVLSDPVAASRALRDLQARIRAAQGRPALFATRAATGFYAELARESDALLVPVAQAWQEAMRDRPDLPLSMEDGRHPGPLGAYLNACVFYACLYGESLEAARERAVRDDAEAVAQLCRAHARAAATEEDLRFLRRVAGKVRS